jgi:hypothetical protein
MTAEQYCLQHRCAERIVQRLRQQPAHARERLNPPFRNSLPIHSDDAIICPAQSGKRMDERGFASAVRTEDTPKLGLVDLKIERANEHASARDKREVFGCDGRHSLGRPPCEQRHKNRHADDYRDHPNRQLLRRDNGAR